MTTVPTETLHNMETVHVHDGHAIMRISGTSPPAPASQYMVLQGNLNIDCELGPDTHCVVFSANKNPLQWSNVPLDVVVNTVGELGEMRHETHAAYGCSINCKGTTTPMPWKDRFEYALQHAEALDPSVAIGVVWIEAPSSLEWQASMEYAKAQLDRLANLRENGCIVSIERDDEPRIVPVHPTVCEGYGAAMYSDRGQFDLGDIRKDGREHRVGNFWVSSPLFPRQNRAAAVDGWFQWLFGRVVRSTACNVSFDIDIPEPLSYDTSLKSMMGINTGASMDFAISNSTRKIRITMPPASPYDVLVTFLYTEGDLACEPGYDSTFTSDMAEAVIDCASKDVRTAGSAAFYLQAQNMQAAQRSVDELTKNAIALAYANFPTSPHTYPRMHNGPLHHGMMRNVSGL